MSATVDSGPNNQLVQSFTQFFREYYEEDVYRLAEGYPSDSRALSISMRDLSKFDHALADDYFEQPDRVRESAEAALAQFPIPVDVDLAGAEVRSCDLPDYRVRDVFELRSNDVNELTGIRGVIHKQTQVKPVLETAAFECKRCGAYRYIDQSDGHQEPHQCQGCEREGPFKIDWDESEYHDSRLIRVQVPPDRGQDQEDANIDVWLEHELCSQVSPGDRVILPAILRIDESGDDNNRQFDIEADARNVRILETDFEDISVSEEEKQKIQAVADDTDPFSTLVNSFAPDIFGYDTIKESIMLQLFGGVTKPLPGGDKERGHSHVALVGDPSQGKSKLLKFASQIAPRSVKTSGKGSSSAGLTASAVRDDFGPGDEWNLEGGAIVKADKGLACVDELDDMDPEDRSSMHEALADMTVSVSKAGINATLNARTTLLAAMNPSDGRFRDNVSIAEQIELDPALLSRFDLIFTFSDQVDEETDSQIAKHELKAWQAGAAEKAQHDVKQGADDVEPDLEPGFVRKYIAYAKQHYTPVLSDTALEEAKNAYVELRKSGGSDDQAIPVTARKLGGIVRLAEASARVRLSETVETSDINRAVRITKQSLKDVGMDPETGELDADIIETGVSTSQRERRNQMEGILKTQSEACDGSGMPKDEFVEILVDDVGLRESMVEKDIEDHFKQKGKMYEPKEGRIAWYD